MLVLASILELTSNVSSIFFYPLIHIRTLSRDSWFFFTGLLLRVQRPLLLFGFVLLLLPLPVLRCLLLSAAGALGHDVTNLAASTASAIIGRSPVSQQLPVKKVILDCVIVWRSVPDWSTKQISGVDERFLDVQVHFSADSSTKIVAELEWVLDSDAG